MSMNRPNLQGSGGSFCTTCRSTAADWFPRAMMLNYCARSGAFGHTLRPHPVFTLLQARANSILLTVIGGEDVFARKNLPMLVRRALRMQSMAEFVLL